jgi:hypothetical protein
MNELLEKRISHGMDYFGRDKKFRSYLFYFLGKKFTYKTKNGKY